MMSHSHTRLRDARARISSKQHTKSIPATQALPTIEPIVVDAVVDMLMTDQGMLRPPEKAAALLALIVELYKQGKPFPPRKTVSRHIAKSTDGHCSVFTVDAALSSRMAEGYLTQVWETKHGNVAARNSIVRERSYVPSKRLVDIVERAKRRI